MRLGVRAAVRSALRRGVGATLVAADDLGQFLLVERPQGLLRQRELLFLQGPPSLRDAGVTVARRSMFGQPSGRRGFYRRDPADMESLNSRNT